MLISPLHDRKKNCVFFTAEFLYIAHSSCLISTCLMGESQSVVTQLCLTLCDPMDCSPPGFSVHGIFQARMLEGVAIAYSKRSS